MRVARDATELKQVLPVARREATTAFGRGDLYVEKLVRNPRHIEVQILADRHGRVEHLWASATARCSGAIRRWSRWRLRSAWTRRSAAASARRPEPS